MSTATRPTSDGSLEPVRKMIPDHCYERSTARAVVHIAIDFAMYSAAVAGLVIWNSWWSVGLLWIFASLCISGLFVLGHDAAHGALFDSKTTSRRVGRFLMMPSLHVYEAWVLGHNRIHHGHTVREGMDFVWHPLTVEQYRAMPRWQRIRHRFEWSWLGSGAYYGREVWFNKMVTFSPPDSMKVAIRKDWWFTLCAAIGGAVLFGGIGWWHSGTVAGVLWMITKVMIVPFMGFIQVIGWTVYVHHVRPDIRWWPRREWTRWRGQMEGTTVVRIQPVIDAVFFHHIFVHVPHHVDMRIPFYRLEEAAAAIESAFPGTVIDEKFRLRTYMRSAKNCKLYNFEDGTWLTYDGTPVPALSPSR